MPVKKPTVKEVAVGKPITQAPIPEKTITQPPIAEAPTIPTPITPELPPLSSFQLPDLHQKNIALSSYRNKQPVLLFFWTTWCPFCGIELKALNDMYNRLTEDGLEVLAIDVGESAEKVRGFLKNYHPNYKVLLDKDGTVAESFGLLGVPTYILINKKGNIVFQGHTFTQQKYKELLE